MKSTLLTLFVVFGVIVQSHGQTFTMNTINKDANAVLKSQSDRIPYQLNTQIFEENLVTQGATIQVEIPSGMQNLTVTRVSEFVKGIKSYRAVSSDGQIFSFTYSNGALNGLYHQSISKTLEFTTNRNDGVSFIRDAVKHGQFCSDEEVVVPTIQTVNKSTNESIITAGPSTDGKIPNNDLDVNTTVDVLIVYTPRAKQYFVDKPDVYESIDAAIAQEMNLTQSVFDNTNTPITYRVVHSEMVTFDEYSLPGFDINNQDTWEGHSERILRNLVNAPDYKPFTEEPNDVLDEVHSMRDEYGADIVVFVGEFKGFSLGFVNTVEVKGYDKFMFSVIRVDNVEGAYYVVAHEMGHNFGMEHSRTQGGEFVPKITGGIYQEAFGFQNYEADAFTVMSYGSEGANNRVPVFSSMRNLHNGVLMGSGEPENMSDVDLAFRKMKSVVSSYRPTTFEPPVPVMPTTPIQIQLDQGDSTTVPFMVQNTGESDLHYSLDFEIMDQLPAKIGPSSSVLSDENGLFADTLLHTGFEQSEGFTIGKMPISRNWRVQGVKDENDESDTKEFNISDENAVYGSQFARFQSGNSIVFKRLVSPYLGALTFGQYKVSFKLRIPNIEGIENEAFYVRLQDGKSTFIADASSGIKIQNGEVSIWFTNRNTNGWWQETNEKVIPGEFYTFDIYYDTDIERKRIYINGEEVTFGSVEPAPIRSRFRLNSYSPSQFEFGFAEDIFTGKGLYPTSYMDIDDLTIIKYDSPYKWMDVKEQYVTVKPGESGTSNLVFNAKDKAPGTYTVNMTVKTNNDGEHVFDVPIQLTIAETVSNENEMGIEKFELAQNFPNPFNPTTKISFSIPQASNVQLQIFDMLGRNVATVLNTNVAAGKHDVDFDANHLASGMYLYRIQAGTYSATRKMMLIK
ncbi:T9SS type A sorting domain-containing protein [bacterium]|nr:MAG: T9SS type A sorting domain-containing protein [bacterium]